MLQNDLQPHGHHAGHPVHQAGTDVGGHAPLEQSRRAVSKQTRSQQDQLNGNETVFKKHKLKSAHYKLERNKRPFGIKKIYIYFFFEEMLKTWIEINQKFVLFICNKCVFLFSIFVFYLFFHKHTIFL